MEITPVPDSVQLRAIFVDMWPLPASVTVQLRRPVRRWWWPWVRYRVAAEQRVAVDDNGMAMLRPPLFIRPGEQVHVVGGGPLL